MNRILLIFFCIMIGVIGCDKNEGQSNTQVSEEKLNSIAKSNNTNLVSRATPRATPPPGPPPEAPIRLLEMRSKKSLVGTVDSLIKFPSSDLPQRGGFWMMGQLVIFDNATFFPEFSRDLITLDSTLEIWGYPIAKGEMIATRIVKANPSRTDKNYIYGVVKDYDIGTSILTAGRMKIDLNYVLLNNILSVEPSEIKIGSLFEVKGDIDNSNMLVASEFTMLEFPKDAKGRYFGNIIEGPVTLSDYVNGKLEILDIPITIDESTEIIGIDLKLIKEGNILSVRGFDLSTPVNQIIFESDAITESTEIKMFGSVFLLDEISSTFVVSIGGFISNTVVSYTDANITIDFKDPNYIWSFIISGRAPIVSNILDASYISELSVPDGTFYPIPDSVYTASRFIPPYTD